jgi:hypothetical protein
MHHPNILPFIGLDREIFTSTNHICMVSPWMPYGSFNTFLRSDDYEPRKDCHRLVRSFAAIVLNPHAEPHLRL